MKFSHRLLCPMLLTLLATLVTSISPSAAQTLSGKISGQVVTEDGQPLRRARVTVIGVGTGADISKVLSGKLALATDAEGRFEADGLAPAPYFVGATAPGYQLVEPLNPAAPEVHYIGEQVTVRMRKGGVITGRVTNAAGEPVVGVAVSAVPLSAVVQMSPGISFNVGTGALSGGQTTDDRGVFRLYGLAPGKYAVVAGSTGFDLTPNAFAGRAPTFHPAATTRDTATPIVINSSEEIAGIDIRYRGDQGHAISGKITGGNIQGGGLAAMKGTTLVLLKRANAPDVVAMTMMLPLGGMNSYALYGVPDGEYEVVATQTQFAAEQQAAAPPRRVTVRGADLSGIDLALTPLASISGKLVLEKLPEAATNAAAPKCETARAGRLDEIAVLTRKDEPENAATLDLSALGVTTPAVPNAQGEFNLYGLLAGRQRLVAQLPDESWYLKALAFTTAKPGTPDPVANGLLLKAGEKLTGLTLTVAVGAASLKGTVKPAAGAKLPARLRVFLVPAEPAAKDNVLRYAEVEAEPDGAFSFGQLAPGKYLLVARAVSESALSDKPARPAAWDAVERAKLRKEAEAVNAAAELKACQRLTNFVLPWK